MAIISITLTEFNAFKPFRHPMTAQLFKELKFFKTGNNAAIGFVSFDVTDKDYSWLIQGKDPNGKFRAIDMDTDYETEDAAMKVLKEKMEAIEKSGETVFTQD